MGWLWWWKEVEVEVELELEEVVVFNRLPEIQRRRRSCISGHIAGNGGSRGPSRVAPSCASPSSPHRLFAVRASSRLPPSSLLRSLGQRTDRINAAPAPISIISAQIHHSPNNLGPCHDTRHPTLPSPS